MTILYFRAAEVALAGSIFAHHNELIVLAALSLMAWAYGKYREAW